MASSMKTAFIRVTKVNMTGDNKDIPYVFTQESIKETLDEWAFSAGIRYWFIEHTADQDDPNDHFHIVIKFRNPTSFETVKNKFPFGDIENAKNIKRAVQYLVHANDSNKKQYPWEAIVTNAGDLTPFKVKSRSQQDVVLQNILERIESGELTKYNYEYAIPFDVYTKNKTVIENAFQLAIDRLAKYDRDVTVLYFYGASGIGKTAFAKMYFDSLGYAYCKSSSDNDTIQDYKGEPGLLLDDFRDTQWKFDNLLKFLDPHTRSSGKSRYHNKIFVGDLIIITSTVHRDFLYKDITMENLKQLRRRIPQFFEFHEDFVYVYIYNEAADKYYFMRRFANPVTPLKEATVASPKCFDSTPFENMGIELFDCPSDVSKNALPSDPEPASSNWLDSKDGRAWTEAKRMIKERKDESINDAKHGLSLFDGGDVHV